MSVPAHSWGFLYWKVSLETTCIIILPRCDCKLYTRFNVFISTIIQLPLQYTSPQLLSIKQQPLHESLTAATTPQSRTNNNNNYNNHPSFHTTTLYFLGTQKKKKKIHVGNFFSHNTHDLIHCTTTTTTTTLNPTSLPYWPHQMVIISKHGRTLTWWRWWLLWCYWESLVARDMW